MPIQMPWTQVPSDPNLSTELYRFLDWLRISVSNLIGNAVALPAPNSFTVKGISGGVHLTWDEVKGADYYMIYESDTATEPSAPLTTVPAARGGGSNGYVRSGIADSQTRFYAVRAATVAGAIGALTKFQSAASTGRSPVFHADLIVNQVVPALAFTKVNVDHVIIDNRKAWDAAAAEYVIPVSGFYQLTSKVRVVDSTTPDVSIGQGVNDQLIDGSWFVWGVTYAFRNSLLNTRTVYLEKGTRIFLYVYFQSSLEISTAEFTVFLISEA